LLGSLVTMTGPATKTCSGCGAEKPLTGFYVRRRSQDGHEAECKDCRRERSKLVYVGNAEAVKRRTRAYHLANPEWSRERLRAHHEANAENRAVAAAARGLLPEVREQRRESSRRSELRRRAIKAASEVVESITAAELTVLLKQYRSRCYICGTRFSKTVVMHWDHFQPLARGGHHTLENLRPACDLCNIRKNAVWPIMQKRLDHIKKEVLALRKSRVESRTGGDRTWQ